MTKPTRPSCTDCGDEVPKGSRRIRCAHCGELVCPWCFHHVHARNHRAAKKASTARAEAQ